MKFLWGSISPAILAVFLVLPSISDAAIVRMNLRVEAINYDNFVTGLQVDDTLGYLEYDDANFAPISSSGMISFLASDFTDFSLSLDGKEYRLGDLSQGVVIYSTEDQTGDPIIYFEADNADINFSAGAVSVPVYGLSGHDPDDPVPTAFSLDFSATVIPVPAAVWLFGSALAGLGWLRRKQTA
jgi:hypothetical protein